MIRQEQCDKVCRILDDVLANRPTERDSLNVAVRKAFDALEKQRWIPVSERLPDKRGDYLVTLCGNGEPWVEIALWNETFGGRWQMVLYNDVDYSDISNVIAWMPLPEPYQKRGEAE